MIDFTRRFLSAMESDCGDNFNVLQSTMIWKSFIPSAFLSYQNLKWNLSNRLTCLKSTIIFCKSSTRTWCKRRTKWLCIVSNRMLINNLWKKTWRKIKRASKRNLDTTARRNSMSLRIWSRPLSMRPKRKLKIKSIIFPISFVDLTLISKVAMKTKMLAKKTP